MRCSGDKQVMGFLLAASVALAGCTQAHRVVIRSVQPPPVQAAVLHSGRLWIELRDHTDDRQCVRARDQRPVCFENVADSLTASLRAVLWPSFPAVREKTREDNLEPGDYLLLVDLSMAPLPSDGSGPGWSAGARGRWQLVRDGLPVTGESLSARSRADFAYGRPLGLGAGEVIDAVAAHTRCRVALARAASAPGGRAAGGRGRQLLLRRAVTTRTGGRCRVTRGR